MLTILMIDDDAGLVETARSQLAGPTIRFESETDFKKAAQRIREVRPDIVILDWFQGSPTTGEAAGKDVWAEIWKAWFCPVVLYSAGDVDIEAEVPQDQQHPFVKTVAKGAKSLDTVSGHLEGFRAHAGALKEVAEDIDRVKHDIMRDLSAAVFTSVTTTDTDRAAVLKRAARRRLAAVMDDHHHISAENAYPWEQYVFPVLTGHPVTGDIIRLTDQPWTNTSAYRVILSPTCDMVTHGGRPCKVNQYLTAKCGDPQRFLKDGLNLAGKQKKENIEKLVRSALNEAQKSGFFVLPECTGLIPLMAVDLRDLELIPTTDVAGGSEKTKKYCRVASIDSPFREYVGWGYMQVGCRPGVPPRDSEQLVSAIAGLWVNPPETK